MKIAFVTLGFKPLRLSGLDVVGERLVEGLLSEGHSITVFGASIGTTQETFSHPLLTIRRIPIGKTDWFGYSYQAARLVSSSGPFDIVHFYDVHFAWAYRRKYVASLHQSFHQRMESLSGSSENFRSYIKRAYYAAARRFLEMSALRRASGLLAVSATTRDEFIRNYHLPANRVALTRNGIDTNFFTRCTDTSLLRQELGLSLNQPVILFAGFITPRKGLEYLAQALPHISPQPVVLIAGRWRSSAYREQIMALFESGRASVIETGFLPDEQMPAYLSMADVYVSPSLLEGFGLPIAESLACETPVVVSKGGAAEEVLGPGGIAVPSRDPTSLARAISTLLKDANFRRELGQRGRRHVEQNFNIQAMVDATLAAYHQFSGV